MKLLTLLLHDLVHTYLGHINGTLWWQWHWRRQKQPTSRHMAKFVGSI